jgi:hypothetical protein
MASLAAAAFGHGPGRTTLRPAPSGSRVVFAPRGRGSPLATAHHRACPGGGMTGSYNGDPQKCSRLRRPCAGGATIEGAGAASKREVVLPPGKARRRGREGAFEGSACSYPVSAPLGQAQRGRGGGRRNTSRAARRFRSAKGLAKPLCGQRRAGPGLFRAARPWFASGDPQQCDAVKDRPGGRG